MLKIVRNGVIVITVASIGFCGYNMVHTSKNTTVDATKELNKSQQLNAAQTYSQLNDEVIGLKSDNKDLKAKVAELDKTSSKATGTEIVSQVKKVMSIAYDFDNNVQTKEVRTKELKELVGDDVIKQLVSPGEDTAQVQSKTTTVVMITSPLSTNQVTGIVYLTVNSTTGGSTTVQSEYLTYSFVYDQSAKKIIQLGATN